MEDVLEVYRCPPNDRCPVVCVDETGKQLVSETRVPLAPAPGQPVRYDYEYRRQGVCNLFMMAAPQQGRTTDHDERSRPSGCTYPPPNTAGDRTGRTKDVGHG